MVKIKGISLNLDGTDYVVPPLTLGALEQFQERIAEFDGGLGIKSISTVVDAATAALKRNYPDITRAQVGELIDVGNMSEVFEALMDVSGLKRKAIEAGEPAPAENA